MPDHVVEVFSAANVVEAHSVRARLEEAGIATQIVGESLGNAAGWLPFGDIAPRIWVRQADEALAREVIAEYLGEAREEAAEPDDDDLPDGAEEPVEGREPVEAETPVEPEEPIKVGEQGPGGAERPAVRVNWVAMVGVACIAAGILHSAYRWIALGKYSARTEGVLVRVEWAGMKVEPELGGGDLPIWPKKTEIRAMFDLRYSYVVGGRQYRTNVKNRDEVAEQATIHYDPAHPADCLVGPIMPPWVSLAFGGLLGAGLLFVAYRFR